MNRGRQTSVDSRKTGSEHIPVASTPYVYRLVIEPDEGRYYAEIPALAGCYSWGHTYEEALKNIKEALELWLEVKKEAGEPIPTDDLGEKLLATDGRG
jgi:predicted RNase H-like HicB family nuclease